MLNKCVYYCIIVIYMYIIEICIFRQHFFVNANFIKHNRYFMPTYFLSNSRITFIVLKVSRITFIVLKVTSLL